MDTRSPSTAAAGTLDNDLPARTITIAIGADETSQNFKSASFSIGEFIDRLKEFEVSERKSGTCFLQGAVVVGTGQRLAVNMARNYTIMLDCDTGQDIGPVLENIRREGWLAIVYPTFSNGKASTDIKEKVIAEWMRKHKRTGEPTVADAVGYLQEKERAKAFLFEGATLGPRVHKPGGFYRTLAHKPWAKHRIVLLLQEPFEFDLPGMSHDEAMQLWKDKYSAVGQRLGLEFDPSCTDPSRLMYVPRRHVHQVAGARARRRGLHVHRQYQSQGR